MKELLVEFRWLEREAREQGEGFTGFLLNRLDLYSRDD